MTSVQPIRARLCVLSVCQQCRCCLYVVLTARFGAITRLSVSHFYLSVDLCFLSSCASKVIRAVSASLSTTFPCASKSNSFPRASQATGAPHSSLLTFNTVFCDSYVIDDQCFLRNTSRYTFPSLLLLTLDSVREKYSQCCSAPLIICPVHWLR